MKIIVGVCCLIAFLSINTKSVNAQKEVLSSFCQLSLSEELMQSNISFTEGFTFKIDKNGKPIDIKRTLGKYVEEEQVKSCLDNWKFSGFVENSRFSVYFSWKHGVGWTQMRITNKDFSQVVVNGASDKKLTAITSYIQSETPKFVYCGQLNFIGLFTDLAGTEARNRSIILGYDTDKQSGLLTADEFLN